MKIEIDDPELDQDAQHVAAAWGKPVDEMMHVVIKQTLQRLRADASRQIDWATVQKIQEEVAKLPVLDDRSADDLLGYNDSGHFD